MLLFIAISIVLLTIIAFGFGSISIFICGILYTGMVVLVTKKIFGDSGKIFQRLTLIWMISVIFILIVYFLYYIKFGLPYDMLGEDDYFYDVIWSDDCLEKGYLTIDALKSSSYYSMHNSKMYLLLIVWMKKIFYSLGGYHTLDIRLFNMTLLIISALLMGKYAERYMGLGRKSVLKIITIISLFPNAMFISSLVYRDTMVTFFIVIVFYLWTSFSKKKIKEKIWIVVLTTIIAYLAYYCRVQAVLYLAVAVGVGLLNNDSNKNIFIEELHVRKMCLYIVAIIGIAFISESVLANFDRFVTAYDGLISQGAGIQARVRAIPLLPIGWLFRLLFFMVSPMNRDIIPIGILDDPLSILRGFVSLGTVYLIFLYPYVLKYLKKMNNIVVVYLTILLSVAIVTSGFRHVMMTYPMLLTIGIAGRSRASRQCVYDARVLSVAALGIGGMAFAFLKLL